MAFQTSPGSMPGIGNVAIRTFQRFAAAVAEGIRGSSPPVEEKDRLFSHLKGTADLPDQRPAEDLAVSDFELGPHIREHDTRRPDTGRPFLVP